MRIPRSRPAAELCSAAGRFLHFRRFSRYKKKAWLERLRQRKRFRPFYVVSEQV